jgi:DNA-binding winged helix-turn-helix (wHTH) protein
MASPGDRRCLIRFSAFEADLAAGELRKHGLRIKLQDQPFQVLSVLLDHPGEIVTRDELRSRLWAADTFVDFDRGLNKAINRLRDALGDSADRPRFIETLPKRGYRFIAPIEGSRPASPVIAPPPEAPKQHPTTATVRQSTKIPWIALGVALGILASALLVFLRKEPALGARDTLVLADFENRTGDAAFDYTLRQALAIDLEQSPYIKMLSEQEIRDNLLRMGRKSDQRLTRDVARELCQRAGSKVLIDGSIVNLGSEYVVGVNAVECLTGGSVAQEQMRANRKEDVLTGLDKVASGLRRKLGESLSSIQRFDRPILQEVSTPSFDAFRAYTDGQKAILRVGRPAGIPFFLRAIELDPRFAMAHMGLGLLYNSFGESALSSEHTRKAYELRGSLSESEKFLISAQYELNVTGQLEKVAPLCQEWSQNYPRDWVPHERTVAAYVLLGRLESARNELQQARQLGDNAILSEFLAFIETSLDHLPAAHEIVDKAMQNNPDHLGFRQAMYRMAFLERDAKRMQEQTAWATQRPGMGEYLLLMKPDTETYFGHVKKARELIESASRSAEGSGFQEAPAQRKAVLALREAEFGYTALARQDALGAAAVAPGKNVRSWAALALALAGENKEARKLADRLNSDFPTDTLVQNYWLPTIRAAIELSDGNSKGVAALLEAAAPYELSTVAPLLPAYLRAEADISANDGPAAAAEFQKILQHRGQVFNGAEGALAHLGLARASVLIGDRANARLRYEEFLAIWRDADPDIPILRRARAEYAGLN